MFSLWLIFAGEKKEAKIKNDVFFQLLGGGRGEEAGRGGSHRLFLFLLMEHIFVIVSFS